MIAIERSGNRREADIGRAAVAGFANNIRELALPLAFADHGFIRRGYARREAAGAANLRVRPRYVIGRAQIRTVRDVHAAGRTDEDRVVARGFARHPVLDGGSATCTGAVTGDKRLARR